MYIWNNRRRKTDKKDKINPTIKMKTVITTLLLMLIYTASLAQNGGQFFENNVIRISYLRYDSGTHSFIVCNKQNCEARIRTKADQDPAVDIVVAPNDCDTVNVFRESPSAVLFRSKAETACITRPDMGWLEINTANIVLNLVQGNTITVVRGPNTFTANIRNGFYKSNYGGLTYIEDIRVYDILGLLKYRTSCLVRKYSNVDLDNYLQTGLNFIEVTIETNKIEKFIFKYVK